MLLIHNQLSGVRKTDIRATWATYVSLEMFLPLARPEDNSAVQWAHEATSLYCSWIFHEIMNVCLAGRTGEISILNLYYVFYSMHHILSHRVSEKLDRIVSSIPASKSLMSSNQCMDWASLPCRLDWGRVFFEVTGVAVGKILCSVTCWITGSFHLTLG
jgi:hypothetical protein